MELLNYFAQHKKIPHSKKVEIIDDTIKIWSRHSFCQPNSEEIIDLHRIKLNIINDKKRKPLPPDKIEYIIYKTEATRGIVRAQELRRYACTPEYWEQYKKIIKLSKALDDHAESIRKSAENKLQSSTAYPKKVFESPVRSQRSI